MDILINIGWLALGLTLLYFGAEWLVGGASGIALRCGLSPLVVGLTVVALGTSAPELFVSVQANFKTPPEGDMALGNIIGSNICNLALVLGIAALIRPLKIHSQIIRREMPILVMASILLIAMLWDGTIQRWEAAVLAIGIIWYVVSSLLAEKKTTTFEELDPEIIEKAHSGGGKQVFRAIALIILGLCSLVYGADRLILGGLAIAKHLGIPSVIIGLTMIALGTSLPELATSIVASFKKHGDLISGNAVGSCIFNILAVLGFAGLLAPIQGKNINHIDLWVMLGITLGIFSLMWRQKKLGRLGGTLLLASYLGYSLWLFLKK